MATFTVEISAYRLVTASVEVECDDADDAVEAAYTMVDNNEVYWINRDDVNDVQVDFVSEGR